MTSVSPGHSPTPMSVSLQRWLLDGFNKRLIFISFPDENEEQLLSSIKRGTVDIIKRVEKVLDSYEMTGNQHQCSCLSCVFITLKKHYRLVREYIKKPSNERMNGDTERHKKYYIFIVKNVMKWTKYCVNNFLTGQPITNYKKGTKENNMLSKLYDQDLSSEPTDQHLYQCMKKYIKVDGKYVIF